MKEINFTSILQHFSDTKFNSNEYLEYPDNEERDREQLDQMQHSKDTYLKANEFANHPDKEESITPEILDKSILTHWFMYNGLQNDLDKVKLEPLQTVQKIESHYGIGNIIKNIRL